MTSSTVAPADQEQTNDTPAEARAMPIWRNRNFTVFWLGQGISVIGSGMALLVMPLLVYQSTGSVARMGQITALIGAGNLLAGLASGILVDRLNRRLLMLVCDGCSALLYAAIPLTWWLYHPTISLLYAIALPLGFLSITGFVAYQACITNLVPPDQLTAASSSLQATVALSFIIGPLIGGALSGLIGAAAVMGVNAATFVVSVLTLAIVRLHAPPPAARTGNGRFGEVLAGLRFIAQTPIVRWTVILRVSVLIVTNGLFDLLIFRLKHELHQDDSVTGLIFGLASIGALLSAILTPWLRRHVGFGTTFLGGMALMGASFILFGFVAGIVIFTLVGMSFTFGDTLAQITGSTLRQQLTPNHLQGRVTAAFQTFLWLGASVGAALTTSLAAHLGSTLPVFWLAGALMLALAALGLLTPARIRNPEMHDAARTR